VGDKKIKIVVIDNQNLFRQALKSILNYESAFEVVGEGNDVSEAKTLIDETKPNIVLMEIDIPGMEATIDFEEYFLNVKVIILSDHDDEAFVTQAFKLGAHGYLLKDADADSLIEAIKIVGDGGSYIDPKVSHLFIKEYRQLAREHAKSKVKYRKAPLHLLTQRECEVLQLLANGKSNRELAEALGISEKTVKNHVGNILVKMNCNDRTQVVVTAFRNGWVEID
jgi:two-component system, NarL family, response regulator DegU